MSYISGFIDADGTILLSIRKRTESSRKWRWSVLPEIVINQKFAGLIDGDGSIKLNIGSKPKMKYDYLLNPSISLEAEVRSFNEFNNFMDQLCSKLNITYTKQHTKRHGNPYIFRWSITGIKNVERLLKSIQPYLIWKRDQCDIMLNEILPRMKEGKHLTKEGIIEIMYYADILASLHGKNSRRKYSENYFRGLWNIW